MAEEYVKGRLPQESNPTPGRYPGFVASHDTTGNEDYRPTSPDNPLPTSNYIQRESGVWVPISKDNPMPTQLTGSKVEDENAIPTRSTKRLVPIESHEDIELGSGASFYLTAVNRNTDYGTVNLILRWSTKPTEYDFKVAYYHETQARFVTEETIYTEEDLGLEIRLKSPYFRVFITNRGKTDAVIRSALTSGG